MKRRDQQPKITVAGQKPEKVLRNLSGEPAERYELRLYVAGTNLNSVRAIENVRELCKSLSPAVCQLEVIDLYQQPGLARRDEVVAAPVLIKQFPLPKRTFIGDLSDAAKVFIGLGIVPTSTRNARSKPSNQ